MLLHIFYTAVWNVLSWGGIWKYKGRTVLEVIQTNPMTLMIGMSQLLGLVMLYACVAYWFNETKFKIEDGYFKIEKTPIPWGARIIKVPFCEIKQVFVQEYHVHSFNDEPRPRYRVMILLQSNQEMIVDSDIRYYPDAKHLEDWLEKSIGIQDQAVPGEVDYLKVA